MKKLITIICLFVLSVSCNNDRRKSDELKSILSDFSTSSYFVAVNVKCCNQVFPIIETNNYLFSMLRKRGIVENQEDYIDKITMLMRGEESILFNEKDKEILENYTITKNDTLDILFKKDKDAFLNKYFENKNRFKSEKFSFDEEKAIIYYLFKNGIYCRRDCISGYVFIDSKINKN